MKVVAALAAVLLMSACTGADDQLRTGGVSSPEPAAPDTPSPTATARPTPTPLASPPPTAGTYLALGDSLAVGVGATQPDATGYVALIHRALVGPEATPRVGTLTNLAVSGETSASMIAGGQLAAALNAIAVAQPPVALVSLDIGGNDLLRLLGTEVCATDPVGAECLQLLALTLTEFDANYRQIVTALVERLATHAPDARLAVMTYFNPFSGTDAAYEAAGELALLGADGLVDCAAADPQARGMNDIIACLAPELGAVPVDIQPRFAGLGLELTHIGSEDIHANDAGYAVIAAAFVEALRQL